MLSHNTISQLWPKAIIRPSALLNSSIAHKQLSLLSLSNINTDHITKHNKISYTYNRIYHTTCNKYNIAQQSVQQQQQDNNITIEKLISCETGGKDTTEYRIFYHNNDITTTPISPWHDIPYKTTDNNGDIVYTYINEISKNTLNKYEIATKEAHNPIAQDVKNGVLRKFKYGDIPFNYGCITQTWEDPDVIDKHTNYGGDNDPIDVVEISNTPLDIGTVHHIKVLGCLILIDQDETDYKIIGINTKSDLYDKLNNVDDLHIQYTRTVEIIKDWFINYKTAEGKSQNKLALNGDIQNKKFAIDIIEQTHKHWVELLNNKNYKGKLWLPTKQQ